MRDIKGVWSLCVGYLLEFSPDDFSRNAPAKDLFPKYALLKYVQTQVHMHYCIATPFIDYDHQVLVDAVEDRAGGNHKVLAKKIANSSLRKRRSGGGGSLCLY